MLVYKGKHNFAKVMTDVIEETTVSQIYEFINHPALSDCKIVIMPDCHAGKGAVVGFTATLGKYVIPAVIGVDIGCGVLACNLGRVTIDYAKFDQYIRNNIPSGTGVHAKSVTSEHDLNIAIYGNTVGTEGRNRPVQAIYTDIPEISPQRTLLSVGTLGGGNHFIEVDVDAEGNKWLLVHSGSRKFGMDIATHHQDKAHKLMTDMLITGISKDLAYLPMEHGGMDYLKDMHVAQAFAKINRALMVQILLKFFSYPTVAGPRIESVHNYIGTDNIIRKGAISAGVGEKILIPLNMRDGTIVATGMGNTAWNSSAPHGAGRTMSRGQAKRQLSLDEFKEGMKGIWTSCVSQKTLDESPGAYKDPSVIMDVIEETAKIDFIMTPEYNFKASE